MIAPIDAIGGYFAIESTKGSIFPLLTRAARYRSARSALSALLRHGKSRRVWIPHFVCDVVVAAVESAGASVCRYALADQWGPPSDLPIECGDRLLCVDFFGLSRASCLRAVEQYGTEVVVIDASQALFHEGIAGVDTIYSPRKFIGLPDGGLVLTQRDLPQPVHGNELDSIDRAQHLLMRSAGLVGEGYKQFIEAERSLERCDPISMSTLTFEMLSGVDFVSVAQARRANYRQLMDVLVSRGYQVPALPDDAVPLCCPVIDASAEPIRAGLIAQKIFVPLYWPGLDIPLTDNVGMALHSRTVYLPCDQRYGAMDMSRVLDTFLALRS
nr:hypothetical protein [Dyella sp. ASV24]